MYGTRYSVFAELPYFDTVRMAIVDPMHNLFLGTAKHMLKIWKELGYLNKPALESIQEKCDQFTIPCDVGKLPRKIVSGFDGFTADEFKNWTSLFSLVVLRGVIPRNDLQCFRKFVLACRYLTRRVITYADVIIADGLLHQFCIAFENLYGEGKVTPNMHLHNHLKQCVLDFGPVYSFWLFSFERYNGILESLPTNKKNIEPQITRRFMRDNSVLNLSLPKSFLVELEPMFLKLSRASNQRGTLSDIEGTNHLDVLKMASR